MRKLLILFGDVLISVAVCLTMIFCFQSIKISEQTASTLSSVIFTLFGFSITSFSIIIGFMDKSEKINKIINKGYHFSIIVSLALMFIYSIVTVLVLVFNWENSILLGCFCGGIILIGYYIYFITALTLNYRKNS